MGSNLLVFLNDSVAGDDFACLRFLIRAPSLVVKLGSEERCLSKMDPSCQHSLGAQSVRRIQTHDDVDDCEALLKIKHKW